MARKPKKQDPGAPSWMVTFSDMTTLLLTFFVLLLSMANMDKNKFNAAAESMRSAFGVMEGGRVAISGPKVIEFAPIQDDFTSRLYQRLLSQLNELKIDRRIQLVKDRGAVILRVDAAVLFASGQTEVSPEAYPVLRDVAALIENLPLNLRIEGHTDETPPSAQGALSNWDISIARAVSTLKFFERENLVPLDRMSAVGYGSRRPLATDKSEAAQAVNRRVEFVLESVGGNREALPYLIDAGKQVPY